MSGKQAKLNENLDPSKFVVCVSTKCALLLDDYRGECRESCSHRREEDYKTPRGKSSGSKQEPCRVCELKAYLATLGLYERCEGALKEGSWYPLKGRYAVEHARRVHAKVRRQYLRFDQVNAVDVGFAIHESEKEFENVLAIRIHVSSKRSIEKLYEEGLPVFSDLRYASPPAEKSPGLRPSGVRGAIRGGILPLPGPYPVAGVTFTDLSIVSYDSTNWVTDCEKLNDGSGCSCCDKCGKSCHHRCKHCFLCCICCTCKTLLSLVRKKCPSCDGESGHRRRLAICGVPLDVVQAGYFPNVRYPGDPPEEGVFVGKMGPTNQFSDEENLQTGRDRVSPLVGGISVGSINGQAGTISAIVWDETDGSPCVLANWHVLAGSFTAEVGQPCYQPALFDGGSRRDDKVGNLKRWHFGELGDAALAELDGSRYFASGEVLGVWHPISGYRRPELNLEIRKWGRTTGFTQGFIDGIELSTNVEYGQDMTRHFEHQFHISPLIPKQDVSDKGDSGALVLVSYDVDDLDVIAEAILREHKSLLKCLLYIFEDDGGNPKLCVPNIKGCSTCSDESNETSGPPDPPPVGGIDDIASLGAAVRKFLRDLEDYGQGDGCLMPKPLTQGSSLEPAIQAFRTHGGGDDTPLKISGDDGTKLLQDFKHLLGLLLEDHGVDVKKFIAEKKDKKNRVANNVYYAVGMIYAGDTPGSAFGEFALASDISLLAEDLKFSLRPVFEPRSSFRKVRTKGEHPYGGRSGGRQGRRGPAREPGDPGSDPRGTGPTPEGETLQSTGPGGSGGG